MTTSRDPDLKRAESECVYLDPKDGKKKPFPAVTDSPSLYLSLVVPAYKEEKRRECVYSQVGPLHHRVLVFSSAKDDERDDEIP